MYRKMLSISAIIAIAASLVGAQAAQAWPVTSVPCSSAALASAMGTAGADETLSLTAGCVYRQATLPAVTANLTIDGNGATLRDGSGLSVTAGTLTVDHLDFRRARIVVTRFGSLAVTGGTFTGNTTSDSGGAIDVYTALPDSGALSVTGAVFTGNTSADGGAIYDFSQDGPGSITDCVLTGNTASGASGAGGAIIASSEAGVHLSGDVIRRNSAAYGGGVFGNAGGVTIDGSRITGNHASVRGGGVFAELTDAPGVPAAVISGTVIRGNTAADGAGIWNEAGTTQVTGSVIARNFAAAAGGGIYNRDGQVTAMGTQVTRNLAVTGGGGIYSAGQEATVMLTTSPVTRNLPDNCEPANTVTGCMG